MTHRSGKAPGRYEIVPSHGANTKQKPVTASQDRAKPTMRVRAHARRESTRRGALP